MQTKFNAQLTLIAIATALLVTACGGGGGSSPTGSVSIVTPPVTTPAPPVVVAGDLQLTVPPATYGAATEESKFFTAYNAFRGQLGLGLVAQNAKFDLAAKNHLAYVTTYSTVNGGPVDMAAINPTYNRPNFHVEEASRAGFTGVTERERVIAAMYQFGTNGYVGEEGAYGVGNGLVYGLNQNIGTIYHRSGLMAQYVREIGLAVSGDAAQTTVIEQGYASAPQRNASDYVGVYPANGQTGIGFSMTLETPNPIPELTYSDYATKTGYPISISTETSTTLTVASFTVTEAGQTAPLAARLFVKGTNTQTAQYLKNNDAYLVSNTAFKPNTKYNVAFTGTVNGVALVRNWSFTTKA